jgi:hypothetical protein
MGDAATVRAAQGVTADTTHAVVGENTIRSMLQGRRERATKQPVIYRAVRNRYRQFWSSRSKIGGLGDGRLESKTALVTGPDAAANVSA